MSTRLDIKSGEHGIVRLFDVDLPKDQIDGFDIKAALGARDLAPEQVELFDVADLTGMGLGHYLAEGYGIPPDQLAGLGPQLDGLKGYVLILPSRALGGTGQTLTPKPPLHLIGTFSEDIQPIRFEKLPDQAAQGNVNTQARTPPSDAAISGRLAMAVLACLALLVGLMIWIAA